jgi:hypothetical protein
VAALQVSETVPPAAAVAAVIVGLVRVETAALALPKPCEVK